ncbi:MAG TPA: RnfABCDGE type electron transport complex subunit B [bacterium]|nr:RnfABCDGE type electron transport complex subunit B [bacterium]HPN43132.1 RnfABCDGE type electron transport complex subunit B [bacterium]
MDPLFIPSIIALGGMGLLFGAGLAFAAKKFAVEVDPRVAQIIEILPGANCGSCGRPGCSAYAEAVSSGALPPNRCTPGGKNVAERISSILGLVGVEMEEPKVAVVQCQGGKNEAVEKYLYEGIHDCNAAVLIGGGLKGCQYGCLGLGSCVKACPFDAMYMNDNGLPVVIEDKCTACGICVSTCPRGIMRLISRNQNVFLGCVSQEKLKAVKSVCTVGCFACKICVTPKVTPSEAIVMEGNLPVIKDIQNSELYEAVKKCPAGSYVIREKSKIPVEPEQV